MSPSSPGVVTMGETMALFRSAVVGPLAHASRVALGIGGAESNLAIALVRLGTPATWISRLGTDGLGDLVLREIRAEGVTPVVVRDATAPTGLMVKEQRSPGASRVTYYRSGSAAARMTPEEVPEDVIRSAQLLHISGISLAISSSSAAASMRAIEIACDAGVPVSFDFNHRASLWSEDDARKAYRVVLPKADLVFAGADEAAILVGDLPPEQQLDRLSDFGPSDIAIKMGAAGCVARSGNQQVSRAAVPVDAVDTVGAGDAFVAGYLAEYLLGRSLSERVELAVQVGAFACTVPGDWEGAPTRADLALLGTGDPVQR